MGRELQKHKNRSSISKATRKPKSKKKLLHHPIIAANWDSSKTLAQNYKLLGLTAKLNNSTGGVEKKIADIEAEDEGGDGLWIDGSRRKKGKGQIEVKEARIERDPETGAIVRIVDEETVRANPLNDPLNDLDTESEDEREFEGFDQHAGNGQPFSTHGTTTAVVEQLQNEASRPVPKYKRKQPEGERMFVEALVRKYGDDYGRMARDMEINYMQRSEGDLKRRVKRWREGGGIV
ncbi:Ribosome biogenesis protein Nop16 [Vermiconidia calcicola]|uniref:Ribosome biogenesis protein Nop16 n=1 Tax=Vermiconidia calcicola TaxID=1690605 RepID=A0ACC3N6U0_9PEZI|nr:Ribosome biogenesis protein Nop16 [Vermiconidia calcicola]